MITLMRKISACMFLLLCLQQSNGQTVVTTQTVRGTVMDKVTQGPVAGAIVVLLNASPVKAVSTDADGKFMLKEVPLGRQTIKVTYMGYKEVVLPNITVNAGKEVVLTIQMEEQIIQASEVVIKADREKNKPINALSVVSTRTFSVEETQKYAAAVNDPARMALSFAGVVQGDDGGNMISIRGNSPNGMLWRMEGVDIPNPNHFSNVGTSGGAISILSSQLMSNSDFMTGAFTAEYGNALSGVFDIRLRKGNNQKREYTFQAGLLGVDFASEGPFKKGYDGSYLVNYRYSTLSLLSMVGVPLGFGVTTFQDLSFNVSLPAKKYGTFGVFGFGGLSAQKTTAEKDSMKWKEESFYRYNSRFNANTGAVGVNHMLMLGKNTFIRSSLVASGTDHGYKDEELNHQYEALPNSNQDFVQSRLSLSSSITHKMSSRSSMKAGVIISRLHYGLAQSSYVDSLQAMQTAIQSTGHTATVQSFVNWNYHVNERLSFNTGLHVLHLLLNNTSSVEPRASMKYMLTPKQTLAFGYGLHGQIQPLGAYFTKDVNGQEINRDLKISKAHHLVASYDINVTLSTHIKTEVYYQHLFNVPVATDVKSSFSLINVTGGYTEDKLNNSGIGRNYGVELTVERFLHKNFYYLVSASLNNSLYRASNQQWYSTLYNTGRSGSVTAGKEWELSEKRKKKVIGLNMKVLYAGGLRYTPIDLAASVKAGETKYVESQAFKFQNPDYLRVDIRLSLKRNYKHSTGTLALDLQNAFNRENVGGQYYDKNTGGVKYWYQQGLIPVLSYRIEF